MVMIMGSVMHLVEGQKSYKYSKACWAIVTMTTVGYGDISKTPLGQALASVLMIAGYGIIAVPTGVVTAELTATMRAAEGSLQCSQCGTPEVLQIILQSMAI